MLTFPVIGGERSRAEETAFNCKMFCHGVERAARDINCLTWHHPAPSRSHFHRRPFHRDPGSPRLPPAAALPPPPRPGFDSGFAVLNSAVLLRGDGAVQIKASPGRLMRRSGGDGRGLGLNEVTEVGGSRGPRAAGPQTSGAERASL